MSRTSSRPTWAQNTGRGLPQKRRRQGHWWWLLGLLAPLAALAAEPASRPLPADKAAQAAIVADGFRVTVFAAEPDIVQPISFCTDARGRLWVAEALNYGAWQPTGKDRIVILEDTDGDGRADSRKVFYEGFNYITGIEVGFGGVWVISPPKLYFIPDRDGDDRPDGEPQVLFDGFGYKESRHNLVNGFTWGPDGWLYGGHGRTSPSDVGRPGTPSDQRLHCDGGVYRIHPTKLIFENFADGTTNPWGVDFDDFGQCFVSNCVNPHLFHMIQGGHYEPWRNRPSSLYAYERLPTIADHLHYAGGKPGALRGETPGTLALGGGHAHCGTLVYLGDRFPACYRNSVFLCNVHGRRINQDILQRQGSGYTARHGQDFMIAADPWFMGVTLRTGPDGNVYVSDWSDTGECHTYRPQRDTGRIYKISYGQDEGARKKGRFALHPSSFILHPSKVDLARLKDDELVKLQMHRNDWYVRQARLLLQERAAQASWNGQAVHSILHKMLASPEHDVPQRLRALWGLHVTGGLTPAHKLALLEDRNEHLRGWAIQLICEIFPPLPPWGRGVGGEGVPTKGKEACVKFAAMAREDSSPVVRLFLASALQRLPLEARWAIAEELLTHAADAADANLPLMYWYGIEPLVPADPDRALRLAAAGRLPLVRQFLARRAAEDALSGGDKGDLGLLVGLLPGLPEKAQLDLLQGAREGLRGRKNLPMPKGWPAVYARLARSANAGIGKQAVLLALVFGDPQALVDLRQTMQAPAALSADRLAALEALIDNRAADLAPVLHDLLGDKVLRRTALRGLASFPHDATPGRILGLFQELTAEEKTDAVATLASRKEYALELLQAVAKKVVAQTDISAYVARQLYALQDREVTERLRQVWGEVRDSAPQKKEHMARYRKLLTPAYLKKADLHNGRRIYAKTCQQCHKLYGEGGDIGPDLTGSNRAELDYLLANLIDPGSEVAKDYRMSIVTTQNGRVITGMIVERSPTRLTMQTATERILFARQDVDTIQDSPLSMMPEGLLEALPREQVRDLVAYLAAKTQVPLGE